MVVEDRSHIVAYSQCSHEVTDTELELTTLLTSTLQSLVSAELSEVAKWSLVLYAVLVENIKHVFG